MTAPNPTASERANPYDNPVDDDGGRVPLFDGPLHRWRGCRCRTLTPERECPASPPAVAASTGTSEDVEALLDCECGHSLDEHNGLGCYARLSYEPLVQCSCALTDDRTHGELLAPRLASLLADREAAARAEERERIAQAIEELPTYYVQGEGGGWLHAVRTHEAARIAREAGTR